MMRSTLFKSLWVLCALWLAGGLLTGCDALKHPKGSKVQIAANFPDTASGRYDRAVVKTIARKWRELLDKNYRYRPDQTGNVVVAYHLHRDGSVSNVNITTNQVTEDLGKLCLQAVTEAAPLEPWPADMLWTSGTDYRETEFTFRFYTEIEPLDRGLGW